MGMLLTYKLHEWFYEVWIIQNKKMVADTCDEYAKQNCYLLDINRPVCL